jgi:hypothetical protein
MSLTREEIYHEYAGDDIWRASPTRFPTLYSALTTPFQNFAIEFVGWMDTPYVQFKFGGIRVSDHPYPLKVLLMMTARLSQHAPGSLVSDVAKSHRIIVH